jgi:hypothetical protein
MPHPLSYQTTGIVIGRTNFGEADRIIRLLTPEHGKISAVAKGVRKIKSRAAGHLELFGEASLMLATGRNLDVITSARLLWYPHQLVAAYDRWAWPTPWPPPSTASPSPASRNPLYALLAEALRAVDGGASGPLPELWFKLRLLQLSATGPSSPPAWSAAGTTPTPTTPSSPAAAASSAPPTPQPATRPMSQRPSSSGGILSDYPYATAAQIADAAALAASLWRPATNSMNTTSAAPSAREMLWHIVHDVRAARGAL